jgi:hypothetical protein
MPEYNIQLRGWHALVGILTLVLIASIQVWLRVRSVDDGMRDAVRIELLNEYSGRGPKDVARLVKEAREGSPVEPVPEVVQREVEFTSIAAHGRMGGPVTFVRAEVTVDGGPPPDGRPVRYFRVSQIYGWRLDGGWRKQFLPLLPGPGALTRDGFTHQSNSLDGTCPLPALIAD